MDLNLKIKKDIKLEDTNVSGKDISKVIKESIKNCTEFIEDEKRLERRWFGYMLVFLGLDIITSFINVNVFGDILIGLGFFVTLLVTLKKGHSISRFQGARQEAVWIEQNIIACELANRVDRVVEGIKTKMNHILHGKPCADPATEKPKTKSKPKTKAKTTKQPSRSPKKINKNAKRRNTK